MDKNNGSQIGITEVNSLVSPRGFSRALGKVLGPRRVSNGADLGGWRVKGNLWVVITDWKFS